MLWCGVHLPVLSTPSPWPLYPSKLPRALQARNEDEFFPNPNPASSPVCTGVCIFMCVRE